jgi:hypothetical protein
LVEARLTKPLFSFARGQPDCPDEQLEDESLAWLAMIALRVMAPVQSDHGQFREVFAGVQLVEKSPVC